MKFKTNIYFLMIIFILILIIDINSAGSSSSSKNEIFSKSRDKRQTSNMNHGSYVDNRKPAFKNCKGYAPSIKEEQPAGTPVIKVEATDPDKQDKIEYSFVTSAIGRQKFQIDSKTGQITTTHIFDRDEPIREKEFYLTVRAADNGRPQLDDVCTFKVIIEDINDNPPVFDKAKYDEAMPQDIEVGKFVLRISASDLDDGNNSIVVYDIKKEKDYSYFEIGRDNGNIKLVKTIDRPPGQYYSFSVEASNIVQDSTQSNIIEVKIKVIETYKRPPKFNTTEEVTYKDLDENYSHFSTPIVSFNATSRVDDKPEVIFELITGRTEQTNSKKTFVFNQTGNVAQILLGKSLDYEQIIDYTLTLSVRNAVDLIAEHTIKIAVKDVNDNIPYFTEVTTGNIPENEPIGTPVMQVRAFDMDGTAANNIVSFELDTESQEFFEIDSQTGNITALKSFDREEKDAYNIKVIATDNSPSALYNNNEHNRGSQVFRIAIADKNDHPPKFQLDEYIADKLPEDANINHLVIEVTALDNDTASQIEYTIQSGNTDDAFKIEKSTGKISVNKKLDYETITEYELKICADDGLYKDYARVFIKIENVNDNTPKFEPELYTKTIVEETIPDGCIVNVYAYDPDIKDRYADQNIKYSIPKEDQKRLFQFDDDGCLRLISPLDRDAPNGHKDWAILITGIDENGSGLQASAYVHITLEDINDNAPFLTNPMPVIWDENKPPGPIIQLNAQDYDESPPNGSPFTYEIDIDQDQDVRDKFIIENEILIANAVFDREEKKEYNIRIMIADSGVPKMMNVSVLVVIIGDENDNAMQEGESNIFIYNYKGEAPDTEIGRVYVNDPDDWDLPDKHFSWYEGIRDERFELNPDTGMITMHENTPEGGYELKFTVVEQSKLIPKHNVTAIVNVEIKEIPEEAVDKSGSIRFHGVTAEEFIAVPSDGSGGGISYKERLRQSIAQMLNMSVTNVDVFTVLKIDNSSYLDVRYSAHASPYKEAVHLNGMIAQNQGKLQEELGLSMYMINIDECLIEKQKCAETSCINILHKSSTPLLVYSNTTSFVGVNAFIQPECECKKKTPIFCLNGGTQYDEACECPELYDGPYCEIESVAFHGDGYGLYPSINPCDSTTITLEIMPRVSDGLILYIGPMHFNPLLDVQDFLSFELIKGYPVLTVDYGSGSVRMEHKPTKLELGRTYQIDILLQKSNIEITVDNCRLSTCMSLGEPKGPNEYLNVNSPVHVGGSSVDLDLLSNQFKWSHTPQNRGFNGCVKKLVIDGIIYNLGQPHLQKNSDPKCSKYVAVAVSFGIDRNFLIVILVCTIVLILLLLVLVVRKKRQDGWHEKDLDDIRETIINYEDEGGGERDTDYDLNVLRQPPIYEDRPYRDLRNQQHEPHEVPDIGGFLVDKKDSCDRDNDAHPLDDVRHYAYEGDGDSMGSLSSLASCTDDGDLKFDYLSSFGPRFRKLADMYGEEPSDTDSNVDGDEGWRI